MEEEILNRVTSGPLVVFDLEDYYPAGRRMHIDISQWLTEGILLREKDFREHIKAHDWQQYQDAFVAISCSTDAIVPAWAEILVAINLAPFAKKVVNGSSEKIDEVLYNDLLDSIDYSVYEGKPVIIKGCSRKPVPVSAYLLCAQHLQKFAKSIMYGEACSAVPLYKKK